MADQKFSQLGENTTPADNDIIPNVQGGTPKRYLWSTVKSALKTYFDTLYATISHTHAQSDITNLTTDLSNKQPLDSDLTAIAGLSPTNDDVIQRKTGAWVVRTMAQIKTDLALVKSDVSLGNVDNTSDADKPVSTAQQTALDTKQASDADLTAVAGLDSAVAGAIASDGAGWIKKTYAQFKSALSLVKGDVGLSNVDNTSDASKPISTATQTALDAKEATANKGAASGYASLDTGTKVPIAQLPDASTSAKGIAELATSAETAAGLVVQASDTRLSDTRTPTTHGDSLHDSTVASLSSGKVPTAELGSGTPDATTFLRGDQSWAAPSGSTPIGYAINFQALTSSPADGATIYIGLQPRAPSTTATQQKIRIPKTGTIKAAFIYSRAGTAGTNENWSAYVRKNNTTDTLIQTLGAATNERIWENTGLSIAVTAGDYIEIKFVNPTWATNPLTWVPGGFIYIE